MRSIIRAYKYIKNDINYNYPEFLNFLEEFDSINVNEQYTCNISIILYPNKELTMDFIKSNNSR